MWLKSAGSAGCAVHGDGVGFRSHGARAAGGTYDAKREQGAGDGPGARFVPEPVFPRADLIRKFSPAKLYHRRSARGRDISQRYLSALIFSPAAVLKAGN